MQPFFAASDFNWYAWVILPIIIFLARMADVTLGTIRIIMVNRGKRKIAPLLGFCEVFIWIVVIGQLVSNLEGFTSFVAYAAGFAVGNYVGMYIEDRMALGRVIVRAIVARQGEELFNHLREAGFGVTIVDGQGAAGPVKLVYTLVDRKNLRSVVQIIHQACPNAFFSVEDVRTTEAGIFPVPESPGGGLASLRKAK